MKHLLKGLLLSLLLLFTSTSAVAEYRTVEVEKLRITVDSDWAAQTTPGYLPIRFDITNAGENRELRIVANSTKYFNPFRKGRAPSGPTFFGPSMQTANWTTTQTLRMKRGDHIKITLPVPIAADNENIGIRIWENGKPIDGFTSNVNTQSGVDTTDSALLFIAEGTGPFAALAGKWQRPVISSGGRYYYSPPTYGRSSTPRSAVPRRDFILDPERVPSNWLGFTSVRGVAVDPKEWGQLSPNQKEAVLTWTAAGGDLLVFDGTLDTVLPADKRPAGLQTSSPTISNYYFGHIHLLNSADIADEKDMASAITRTEAAITWPHSDWALPANRAADFSWMGPRGFRLPIDGVGGIPTKAYLSMLVIFSIIIGPLNYFYLWRKKQHVMLVLTVPLLSLLFVGMIVVYGFLGEGISVRGRAATFTILDQSTKQAATRAGVSLYSGGITPGGGLTFPGQFAVLPQGTDGIGLGGQVALDFTDSQRFTSGLLKARSPSNFEEVVFGPARERITIERSGNDFTAVNGMGSDISQLYFRDAGKIYAMSGALGAGQKGTLRPGGAINGTDLYLTLNSASLDLQKFKSVIDLQPNGTYLAVLDKSPFWDPGLPKIDEKASLHVVLGFVGGAQ